MEARQQPAGTHGRAAICHVERIVITANSRNGTETMRFRLLDKITQLEPGKHIEAVKQLSADEGYLKDHFPRFPVMPGVLMLEAMFQAAVWLVRKTNEFAQSVVVLKEARNVKFSGFVEPGQTLTVTADIKKDDAGRTTLMTRGSVDGESVLSARLILERFNLVERYPERTAIDPYLRGEMRQEYERLMSPSGAGPNKQIRMRWMWIDRMVEFVRGERSVAVKNVSLTEDPNDHYMPGFPIMPCSLIVEGIALTGGILANDQRDFEERIVLAKVNKAVFHRPARPGDQLIYTAVIEGLEPEGAFVRGTSHVGDELQAEVDLFLAHIGDRFVKQDLIDPLDTLRALRMFGLYDVGRTADGVRIEPPERLLQAERDAALAPAG
jgi:3-hydroxyacyl-[acyl-carrier-protein] dehydratase